MYKQQPHCCKDQLLILDPDSKDTVTLLFHCTIRRINKNTNDTMKLTVAFD